MSAIEPLASGYYFEPVVEFFTKTIPEAFQTAWDATANWVDEYVRPIFDACYQWFAENADWLWIGAAVFVGIFSLTIGVVLSCMMVSTEEASSDLSGKSIDTLKKRASDFQETNPLNGNRPLTGKHYGPTTTPPNSPQDLLLLIAEVNDQLEQAMGRVHMALTSNGDSPAPSSNMRALKEEIMEREGVFKLEARSRELRTLLALQMKSNLESV